MTKKRLLIIISLSVIILPILIYKFFSFQASLQYKEGSPPRKTAESLKSLVVALLQGEEGFVGNVSVSYIDPMKNGPNKAQIKIFNNAIYDDSIGPVEYIAIAENKDGIWRITNYKSHWKCKRHIIPQFWVTSACI